MSAGQARQAAKDWVAACLPEWPGIVGAHFVGGITSMSDDEPLPAYKDVDLHLIFAEGSPLLSQAGPFMNILEVSYGGISLEAGVRTIAEYRSAEAVLCNPEIAHHLTLDSLLYDPSGFLHGLQTQVRHEYPRRAWVLARVEHERDGLAGAMALRPMVAAQFGALSEVSLLGYGSTFITALLSVAALKSPRIGGAALVHLRNALAACDRLDLYDEMLEVLGVRRTSLEQVEQLLLEATEAFDLALAVRTSPHPFQHKLHSHLRPYFVESSRAMLDAGDHREAMPWICAYYSAATDILLADGPEAGKPRWLAGRDRLLVELGCETAASRAARFEQAHLLYDRFFMLASDIIARHPGIFD